MEESDTQSRLCNLCAAPTNCFTGQPAFHFLGYNSGGKRDPSCFNFKLIPAFTPPLWNIKAVVEGEHVDTLSYLRWNMKVRWYDSQPPFVT